MKLRQNIQHGDTETLRTAKIARIAKIAEIENLNLEEITGAKNKQWQMTAFDHQITRSRAITRS